MASGPLTGSALIASAAIPSDWARREVLSAATSAWCRGCFAPYGHVCRDHRRDHEKSDDNRRDSRITRPARAFLFGPGLPLGGLLLLLQANRLLAPIPVQDRRGKQVVRDLVSCFPVLAVGRRDRAQDTGFAVGQPLEQGIDLTGA